MKKKQLTVNCGVLTGFNHHLIKLDSLEIPPVIQAAHVNPLNIREALKRLTVKKI